MYTHHSNKTDLSAAQLKELATRFEAIQNVADLAKLLNVTVAGLEKMAAKPQYFEFRIPKPGGQKRLIQNPAPPLKTVQQQLNRFLQASYYQIKPACAHGFIISPAEELHPRNIYTNAVAHLRGHWFLNIDLEDFFHTIHTRHLHSLFQGGFGFSPELSALLIGLCTYQQRLPMGAPTSPVLSNFVFWYTDRHFTDLAKRAEGVYTRYADDLTFSFPRPPEPAFAETLRIWLEKNGFRINDAKTRLQGRLEQPEITGLLIGKAQKPVPSAGFIKTVKKEVNIYNWLVSEAVQQRAAFPFWIFEHFRKSVVGQVEFIGFVLGKGDRTYQRLAAKMRWGEV